MLPYNSHVFFDFIGILVILFDFLLYFMLNFFILYIFSGFFIFIEVYHDCEMTYANMSEHVTFLRRNKFIINCIHLINVEQLKNH